MPIRWENDDRTIAIFEQIGVTDPIKFSQMIWSEVSSLTANNTSRIGLIIDLQKAEFRVHKTAVGIRQMGGFAVIRGDFGTKSASGDETTDKVAITVFVLSGTADAHQTNDLLETMSHVTWSKAVVAFADSIDEAREIISEHSNLKR